jgi:hypothetical protein
MSEFDTADFSVAESSSDSGEGFDSADFDFADENTPLDLNVDDSNGFVSESDEPTDYLFEVDGSKITLDEAKNGYLRQSDYTKKTQELAEMRQRLADAEAITEALRSDPENTLKALGDAFGVGMTYQDEDSFMELDPDEQRIAILEQKIAAQEQAATQAAIEAELNSIKNQYGEFDESALFAHAIKGGFPNLRSAYADMNFNSLQARLAEIEAKKAEEQKRIAAKRQAANTVHNGASRNGSVDPAGSEGFGSLREAYLAAKKSLGA